jgi:hypothetical protein
MESRLGKGSLPQGNMGGFGVLDSWLAHHMNQPLWVMDLGGGN